MGAGGGDAMARGIPAVMTHSWQYMGHASQNPMGVEIFGLVMGLGFVLSFGYWCTDFLVVQRAMAANSRSEEHTSELQSRPHLVCRLLLEKKRHQCTAAWHTAD